MDQKAVLNALFREDLSSFIQKSFEICYPGQPYQHAPYIDAIAWELEQTRLGFETRLNINLPPKYLKSFCVSVAFVAFVLGHNPSAKFIVASYGSTLATEMSNLTRKLMESDWYKALFPGTQIDPQKNTEDYFKTTKNGSRFGTTIGGQVTGLGADFIIMDDLLKPGDALSDAVRTKTNEYLSLTLMSRLTNKKTGVMINVMQRLHPDDPSGHIIGKGGWRSLKLPAIAVTNEKIQIGPNSFFYRKPGDLLHPEREDLGTLQKLKQGMGEDYFAAQYQQLPVLPGGNMIKLHWFKRYDVLPPLHYFECFVQSWDTAVTASETSSYSVCTTWGKHGNLYYLVDLYRAKIESPDLLKIMWKLFQQYAPKAVIIERTHLGIHLRQIFRNQKYFEFQTMKPEGSKEERAAKQSPKIEAGRVFIPTKAPWLEQFEKEVQEFPKSTYDDQVDSLTQFLGVMDYKLAGVNF